ncbi:MAG: hypothetical protein WBA97_19785 [Actinophytocola sp.]|uniref:hypothetical protein n=1 Tax=Actinophytocola sp. TaxID=1872138 RepID=UPI003C7278CC
MPRRNRDRRVPPAEPRPLGSAGWQRAESAPDGDWLVRNVSATQATKTYRCPGCDHEIQPGVAHVVVWPADDVGSIADRRHWHLGCWQARGRRRPTRKR